MSSVMWGIIKGDHEEVCEMELQRAKEIASSPVMAHVTHEGHQVYIQSVDEGTKKARVYHLKNPDRRYEVHVHDLTEQHVVH